MVPFVDLEIDPAIRIIPIEIKIAGQLLHPIHPIFHGRKFLCSQV
jgi:hypothetical protein